MPERRNGGGDQPYLPVTEETLCAYADGWLDTARRLEVEACLADDPAASARVAAYRKDIETLHRIYDPLLLEPLPPALDDLRHSLQDRLGVHPAPLPRRRHHAAYALAAVVLAVFAGVATRLIWPAPPADALLAVLSGGDATPLAAASDVADGAAAAVVPAAAPDRPPAKAEFAPDLASHGFSLIGTRVLAGDAPRTIELEYEDAEGRRVSLYYTPNDKEAKRGVSLTQEGPVALLFWHADGRSYAMIGEVPRDVLLTLGRVVSADLAGLAAQPPSANQPDKLPSDLPGRPAQGGEAAQPSDVPGRSAPRTDAPATAPPVPPDDADGAVAPQDAGDKRAGLSKI